MKKFIKYLDEVFRGVTFIILRPDNTALMQLRDNNSKRFKNMWCFPGGSCDYKEKFIDTVIREIKEEYNLSVKKENCELLMKVWLFRGVRYVYICRIDGMQEPVLYEGADMKWMNIDEIKKLEMGFKQSKVVTKLDTYLKQD